ncbi:MAG: sulfotransferase [Gemmatimonadota bacterium]
MVRSSDDTSRQVKVLYILGFARSGSTILGNLLGEIDGFFHLGEVHRLWLRFPRRGVKCGCREELQACPFWAEVIATTMKKIEAREAPAAGAKYADAQALDGLRPYIPQKFLNDRDLRRWAPSEDYARTMEALFHSVAEVSGARVLVDSSKSPALAKYMWNLSTIVPYVLHMVRDPRGSVFSRQRRKARFTGGRIQIRPSTAASDSLRWARANLAAHAIRRSKGARGQMFLPYEEFISHPEPSLRRIVELMGENPATLPLLDGRTALLETNHTVSGNVNRYQTGEVKLRLDDRWVRSMKTRDHLLVTSLTVPLLLKYGYSLRRPESSRVWSNDELGSRRGLR